MSNAVRSRGGSGSRSPGLIDPGATKASGFHYNNTASIELGGTDEYIVGPSMDSLATFTKEFSVSMWFKWEASAPIAFRFLAEANTTAATLSDGWGLFWHDSNTLKFFLLNWNQADKYAISTVVADIGTEWHHVVGVYDGNQTLDTDTVKIYVDGVVGSNVGTMTLDMNALDKNVEIGRGGNAGNGDTHYMRGHGDEFAIWDTPLSAAQVTAIYNSGVPFDLTANTGDYTSASDLKLHWRLGEEDTNTVDGIHDASGNGHTATMTNMEDGDIDTTDWAGI
jgi:hypothetical protein